MQNKVVAAAAALIVVSGCANQPGAAEEATGRVTVDGTEYTGQSLECTQVDWFLTIKMAADEGRVETRLQLEGEQQSVETVNITNVGGFDGVVGGEIGDADMSVVDGIYTITGTAEGSDRDNPAQTRTVSFEIEAPC